MTPRLIIFIKTYRRDKEWLGYCLRGIHKFITGHARTVVVCEKSDQPYIAPLITDEMLVLCEDAPPNQGYIHQQLVKMRPDNFGARDCDYVVHLDSDCIALRPCDLVTELFVNGRPRYLITPYDALDGVPWRAITEKAVGFPVTYEYMRRLPIVYPIDFYAKCQTILEERHGVTVDQYAYAQPFRAFSEFNIMGAIAHRHYTDLFHWHDTTVEPPPAPHIEQHWSWGGLTTPLRTKFAALL